MWWNDNLKLFSWFFFLPCWGLDSHSVTVAILILALLWQEQQNIKGNIPHNDKGGGYIWAIEA